MNTSESYCTFRVDNLNLGIEVSQVQEVIRYQTTTSVPAAPSVVHGLMNLRGQIVIALDLRQRLGLGSLAADSRPMNVVVRAPDGPVSFLVDEIGDVVQVDESRFERTPETLQGAQREFIQGALKLENDLLLILDTERVLQTNG